MATINWPWAIVLCRFSDLPAVPRQPDYYRNLFTVNGTGGMCDYWRTVSCNTLDLTGSQVFGWFTMNHVSTELAAVTLPGHRKIPVQWGIEAAQANGVNLAPFRSILVVQNAGNTHGAAGNGILIIHRDPYLCEFGFICHEMGHGFGLPDSWAAGNPDEEYGDGWDVMSWQTNTYNFLISFQDAAGRATVGLNARNLHALNAIPTGRLWSPAKADFSQQITLDPLNQIIIGNHGFLIAAIPPGGTRPKRANNSAFTIEFHQKAGWDQAIPEDAVIIHEIRDNGLSYLLPGVRGQFVAGQQFVTPDPKVYVRVMAIDHAIGTATVSLWDIPEGSLRREYSDARVFLINNGTKRWVVSPNALFALGKTWADVRVVPDGGLDDVPVGSDVHELQISVTPFPVPLKRDVIVTVNVTEVDTGMSVGGQVKIDGRIVGNSNTPFSHTFRIRRVLADPGPPRIFEKIYPTGSVLVPGYPEKPLDFGFPEV
ncbi:MAG: hypothetical protein WCD37_07315 [Chloroflexia bacterium]